jgi:hypothetical protein
MRSMDIFNLSNPSSCTIILGFTQPVTEMSTRNPPGGTVWLGHKADNPNTNCVEHLENEGASTSQNPYGHPPPVIGIASLFYLLVRHNTWQIIPTTKPEN